MTHDTVTSAPTMLIVGASRGLGRGMALGFLAKGWNVIATVRDAARADLAADAGEGAGQLRVETLDMTAPDQIAALRDRLAGVSIDLLFVNAGITTEDPLARVDDVSTDEFVRVMVTNALSPMRVIEAFVPFVAERGVVGVMSSGQGSITNNEKGTREVYRASKAALNMLLRSFAARPEVGGRALVALAPGWIQTDLGGPDAPFTVEDTVPLLVDLLIAARGTPGLRYLDRFGATVPW